MELNAQLNLFLLGKKGAGKSSSGNAILGRQAFTTKKCSSSVTQDQTIGSGTVNGFPVTVYDTPGFFDPELSEHEIQQKIKKALQKSEQGVWAFLIVIKADRFTEEERITVEKIEKLLGEKRFQKTWILFTRADELEDDNVTEQEFLNRSGGLEKLVQKYDQRYHMFNNKKRGPSEQVKMLLTKIIQPFVQEKDGERLTRLIPDTRNPALDDPQVSSLSPMRIVLLGKTGAGKSAAGNTILGRKEFKSKFGSNSGTNKCSAAQATVSGRSVSVVDTPGFFDTTMKYNDLSVEIARSVYISSPGPHAFLIVLRVDDRFTEHEQQIPQQIEMVFGEGVVKYSIILFTRGDMLEEDPIEEIIKQNCRLRSLVQQCGGRYHVFNNKHVNNRQQVEDLLQKIDSMVQQNGGGHYSNQMYKDAQRFRQEEEARKQREEKERKLQEKQRQQEIERMKKEIEKIRSERVTNRITEREKQNQKENERLKEKELQSLIEQKFRQLNLQSDYEFRDFYKQNESMFTFSAFTLGGCGATLGGIIGATFGAIFGPAGAMVGGTVGAVVGAAADYLIDKTIWD